MAVLNKNRTKVLKRFTIQWQKQELTSYLCET